MQDLGSSRALGTYWKQETSRYLASSGASGTVSVESSEARRSSTLVCIASLVVYERMVKAAASPEAATFDQLWRGVTTPRPQLETASKMLFLAFLLFLAAQRTRKPLDSHIHRLPVSSTWPGLSSQLFRSAEFNG